MYERKIKTLPCNHTLKNDLSMHKVNLVFYLKKWILALWAFETSNTELTEKKPWKQQRVCIKNLIFT